MDKPELPPPFVHGDSLPGVIRAARRYADMSQRELAKAAGVGRSTIAKLETGTSMPSLSLLLKILDAARINLVATDDDGCVLFPMRVWDDTLDGAERMFPAHLDLILDPTYDDWWASQFGLARPPETFHRDRRYRDAKRRLSQWWVRVQQHRNTPPPPDPDRPPPWLRHRRRTGTDDSR